MSSVEGVTVMTCYEEICCSSPPFGLMDLMSSSTPWPQQLLWPWILKNHFFFSFYQSVPGVICQHKQVFKQMKHTVMVPCTVMVSGLHHTLLSKPLYIYKFFLSVHIFSIQKNSIETDWPSKNVKDNRGKKIFFVALSLVILWYKAASFFSCTCANNDPVFW